MIASDISSARLRLTPLEESRVTQRYLGWMNNPVVVRYVESRHLPLEITDLIRYVDEMGRSPDNYIFAIVMIDSGEHVGNIKLGPINRHHLRAPIGLIIGEELAWGRGIATEAIELLSRWAFSQLGLRKLVAGSYAENIGSIRAFQKAGFLVEGRHPGDVVLVDGSRGDAVTLGMLGRDER